MIRGAIGIASGVGPFPQAGLDESFRLAVGLRSAGFGDAVLDAHGFACASKKLGANALRLSERTRCTRTPRAAP